MKPLTDRELLELIAARQERIERALDKLKPKKEPKVIEMDLSGIKERIKKQAGL